MEIHSQPKKVRAPEAAAQIGISVSKLNQLRRAGIIGSVRLGHRTVWYMQAEINAFIESKSQPRVGI